MANETETTQEIPVDHSNGEGLMKAFQNGKWFHILPDGARAYDEKYDEIGIFHEGLAGACKDGKWLHIRPDGTRAYDLQYDEVGVFSEGLAVARDNRGYFHIHPDGTPAYPDRFAYAFPFINGKAIIRRVCSTGGDGKMGVEFHILPDGTITGDPEGVRKA